ncbi:MAG: Crp/Fnr family transcriptional regulator [Solirubrobacteraceae bacterium]
MSEDSAPDLRDWVEPIRRAEPTWSPHGIRLLDVDPDFGTGLSPTELADVEQHVVLPTVRLERGLWEIEQLRQAPGVRGEPRGFLVVAGTVTIDLAIAGQVCTRLLTPRELVLLDGWEENSIPVRAGWSVLDSAMLAVLDHRVAIIGARWPGLMDAILKRAAQQVRHALLQQAISQLPRVEDRLLALLWSIADRQGVVRADGVWVHLPVTHATLAQMIGARRPTVSLGLRALTERGLVRSEGSGWLISPASIGEFPPADARPDIARG